MHKVVDYRGMAVSNYQEVGMVLHRLAVGFFGAGYKSLVYAKSVHTQAVHLATSKTTLFPLLGYTFPALYTDPSTKTTLLIK